MWRLLTCSLLLLLGLSVAPACSSGSDELGVDNPTAAPGGQRAMQLPQGSQGFVAWGPLAEGLPDGPRSGPASLN